MAKSQFSLLLTRRFMPMFLTQFLGAFNDNFFKSALMMLITYKLGDAAGIDSRILVNAAAGIFILPFFIFAPTASDLADKYDRSDLMRWVKFAEIVIMAGAALGFWLNNVWLLMAVLFLMGSQSAFFSPAKYSILPQHLNEDELIAGNGLIQMGTYLAILTGTIAGGLMILKENGIFWVGGLAVTIAFSGWVSSMLIPPTKPINPNLKVSFNIVSRTAAMFKDIYPMRKVFGSMLAISWFWLVGSVFLAQFPTYSRLILGTDESVATSFLAIFSCGIGLGSMACNAILKSKVTTKYVPAAAYGIAIASILLWLVSDRPPVAENTPIIGALEFFSKPENFMITFCLFAIAFCGGLYIVPLYAVMQTKAPEEKVSSVIACSNISDSIFMAVAALGAGVLISWGITIPQLFLTMGPSTFIVGLLVSML
ncbi:MAG: MFS transporter [Synergistaceae bacterium]|nr:MFS transporter [Synergistaceae bacterium]MBQ6737541.1 MFS transporter [Synergistaceae bacterium]MBQ7067784.1 MFS transporter [Synergistaceae bacterium]MBR0081035.1 MFS transporter [Synergistaceae bacterium]MBR0252390.1 MFS transporter [Synergistaceae bacterium]